MELPLPTQIQLAGATRDAIGDAQALAAKVNRYRPFPAEVTAKIRDRLFPDRVYSSNAIEGNTLTLRETREILTRGHISQRRQREGTEAQNLGKAIQLLEAEMTPPNASPHSIDSFLQLHQMLMTGLLSDAGQLRRERVMISGAKHQPPRPDLVHPALEQVFDWLNAGDASIDPIFAATWTHWAIARIHPFADGNGRMARLWQDLVLLRNNLAPAVIRLQDRDQNGYYDALASADDGDFNDLTVLVAQRCAQTLETYLKAQEETSELDSWASQLTSEVAGQAAESRKASYLRWARQMESIAHDFERVAARVTGRGIEIQVRRYPMIDETTWDNVRTGAGGSRLWSMTLTFRVGAKQAFFIFFFGKHIWSDHDTSEDKAEPRVCLLISHRDRAEDSATLLGDMKDPPASLREIFVSNRKVVGILRDASRSDQITYVRDDSALELAKTFVEQVLRWMIAAGR